MNIIAAVFFAAACILSGLSAPAEAQTQKRIALLIGNAGYKPDVGKLVNPHNDITQLARALRQLDFVVETVPDAGFEKLYKAVSAHARRVRSAGAGAISFVYYSGHGAQDATTGTNYLIPIDVTSAEDGDLLWEQSVSLTDMIRKLRSEAGDAIHFVVFDACRNTLKLKRAGSKALIQPKGFVPVAQENRMLIAYATAEGELASDDGEAAGPYAKLLAEEIVKPGFEVVAMFRNVQVRVLDAIGQQPWLSFGPFDPVFLAGQSRQPDLQTTAMQTAPTLGRAPEVECDRLAAHADDPEAVVSGVDFGKIQAQRAIRACERARSQYPSEKRFSYQLARAYLVARNPRAKELLEELARNGYLAAFNALGFMYDEGIGVREDNAAAIVWSRQGADKGSLPAMARLGKALLESPDIKDQTDGAAWIEKAAEAGNSFAMYLLGSLYQTGGILGQDKAKGVHWIERGARAGLPVAMEAFGVALSDGDGVAKDEWKAADWLRKAAEAGRPTAMVALGDLYADGRGVAKDSSEAFRRYRDAAEIGLQTGDTYPICILAHAYLHGRAVATDPTEAAKWFKKAAEGGCVLSMVNLGLMYAKGNGVQKDDAKAMEWFRKATETAPDAIGCPFAQAFFRGNAITKDLAQPAVWFTKAAEAGCPYSMYSLGLMHAEGRGLPKDDAKAMEWFRKSMDGLQKRGTRLAMLMLADIYRHGRVGPKNDVEAFNLALKSAEAGDEEAMSFVGEMYELGQGVAKNEKRAAEWYRKGSEAGAPTAMLHLGRQYAEGRGVSKSEGHARELFRKAATAENAEYVWRKAVAMIIDPEFGLLHHPDQTATLMFLTLASESQMHREYLIAHASEVPIPVRMAVQKRLKNAGVYRGNIDGNFASTTKVALQAYASRQGERR
jgi:uncharacterized protein